MKIKSLNSKKADISMNMIVVAAIAIIVLLVVLSIFANQIRKPANTVNNVNKEDGQTSIINEATGNQKLIHGIDDIVKDEKK